MLGGLGGLGGLERGSGCWGILCGRLLRDTNGRWRLIGSSRYCRNLLVLDAEIWLESVLLGGDWVTSKVFTGTGTAESKSLD